MRDSKKIISEIKTLLDELGESIGIKISSVDKVVTKSKEVPKGALEAINMLMAENFLDKPKKISLILERLREVGHYHNSSTVAMNLLNLTKRRILNRFKNKETKNWEYVIRK